MRLARPKDLTGVFELYRQGVARMRETGLYQWEWGDYPNEELLREDVALQQLYLLEEEGAFLAAVVVNEIGDPLYDPLPWRFGTRPAFMHRLVVSPACQGRGVGKQVMAWVIRQGEKMGCDCLRLDTSSLNRRALALYEGLGMSRVGEIYYDDPTPYPCFELDLKKRS